MRRKTFKAELLAGHKDAAVEVPFDPITLWNVEAKPLWKGRKGFEVEATVNGVHFESCIVPRQKRFYMLVDKDVIAATGVTPGDLITASVKLTVTQ
ncbi:MAG TPA: DUF1905 domain-containing protein [Pyrinomonadaceae bacterium]